MLRFGQSLYADWLRLVVHAAAHSVHRPVREPVDGSAALRRVLFGLRRLYQHGPVSDLQLGNLR
jgi:hypothetical protein